MRDSLIRVPLTLSNEIIVSTFFSPSSFSTVVIIFVSCCTRLGETRCRVLVELEMKYHLRSHPCIRSKSKNNLQQARYYHQNTGSRIHDCKKRPSLHYTNEKNRWKGQVLQKIFLYSKFCSSDYREIRKNKLASIDGDGISFLVPAIILVPSL